MLKSSWMKLRGQSRKENNGQHIAKAIKAEYQLNSAKQILKTYQANRDDLFKLKTWAGILEMEINECERVLIEYKKRHNVR